MPKLSHPMVAPVQQGNQYGKQIQAFVGQPVFVTRALFRLTIRYMSGAKTCTNAQKRRRKPAARMLRLPLETLRAPMPKVRAAAHG